MNQFEVYSRYEAFRKVYRPEQFNKTTADISAEYRRHKNTVMRRERGAFGNSGIAKRDRDKVFDTLAASMMITEKGSGDILQKVQRMKDTQYSDGGLGKIAFLERNLEGLAQAIKLTNEFIEEVSKFDKELLAYMAKDNGLDNLMKELLSDTGQASFLNADKKSATSFAGLIAKVKALEELYETAVQDSNFSLQDSSITYAGKTVSFNKTFGGTVIRANNIIGTQLEVVGAVIAQESMDEALRALAAKNPNLSFLADASGAKSSIVGGKNEKRDVKLTTSAGGKEINLGISMKNINLKPGKRHNVTVETATWRSLMSQLEYTNKIEEYYLLNARMRGGDPYAESRSFRKYIAARHSLTALAGKTDTDAIQIMLIGRDVFSMSDIFKDLEERASRGETAVELSSIPTIKTYDIAGGEIGLPYGVGGVGGLVDGVKLRETSALLNHARQLKLSFSVGLLKK